jgi:hypothetical protein
MQMKSTPFSIPFLFGLVLLTCPAARAQTTIAVEGLSDQAVYADSVSFRVPEEPGHETTAILDDQTIEVGEWVVVDDVDYHELRISRTRIADQLTENALIQFIVRASERGSTELGLPPWTPYPPIPSADAEFSGSTLRFFAPQSYPENLPIPLAAFIENTQGNHARVNGVLHLYDNFDFPILRGVGTGFLPPAEPGMLSLAPAVGGLTLDHPLTIESDVAWTQVAGVLEGDTEWPANARIQATDSLTVPAGATLTIQQGTVILMAPEADIIVHGTLEILGELNHPVCIVPADLDQPWGGIITTEENPAKIEATATFFLGSGADQNWFNTHSGYDTHRKEQACFLLDHADASFSHCFFVNGQGQMGHGKDSQIIMDHCIGQSFITGGEYVGGSVSIRHSAIIECPAADPVFADADNDGLYFTRGNHSISYSLVGWTRDDALDAGSGGAGSLSVTSCWLESVFHEAGAWSGGGRIIYNYNTVALNCGQGFECGWSSTEDSPMVTIGNCLSIGNLSGLRFGDNYDWTYNGFLDVENSIILHNYRDIFGFNWDDWTWRDEQMNIRNNYLSTENARHPNNTAWSPETDASQLDPFLTIPVDADVGIGFATWENARPRNLDQVSIPVGLSTFISHPVSVGYQISNGTSILEDRTLLFEPGEIIQFIYPAPATLADPNPLRITLKSPVQGVITGEEKYYLLPALPEDEEWIPRRAEWRYWDRGGSPGPTWMEPGFDDSEWPSGAAELGYGDGDETTVIGYGPDASNKYITTYFRKAFAINSLSEAAVVEMQLTRDDGAVVFLNGREIARPNMPEFPEEIGPATAALSSQDVTDTITLSGSEFVEGQNTIAVEIHQRASDSSDISFALQLVARTERQAAPLTPMMFEPGALVLFWDDQDRVLEYSPTPSGPWEVFPVQSSPTEIEADEPAGFFRAVPQ